MNRKQAIILLVLVAVIGGIGISLYNKTSDSYVGSTRAGEKLLGQFNINDVAHIRIKQDATEVNLVKENDRWTVKERGGYPANFEQISDLVRKSEDLKVIQTMPVGPSQRERVGLAEKGPKAATLVEFKAAGDKELKTFLLGSKHMRKSQGQEGGFGGDEGYPDGRYVLASKDAANVSIVSEPFSNAEPKPETWLNKDFFKIEKIKAVTYTAAEATNSWKVSRDSENGDFKMADVKAGETVDTNKLSGIGNSLSYPSVTDVVHEKKSEELGLDKPTTVTVQTFDGFTYTFKLGSKSAGDSYYLQMTVAADLPKERTPGKDEKKEDKDKLDKEFKAANQKLEEKLAQDKSFEKWTYVVPKFTFEQLVKNRSEWMVDKTPKAAAGEGGEDKSADSAQVESIVPPALP